MRAGFHAVDDRKAGGLRNGARQSGVWMLDQVTRWQSMNWDYSGKLQKAQMDVAAIEANLSFRL
jgi:alpha-ketoglutaric semialdehyde dehydrogenase